MPHEIWTYTLWMSWARSHLSAPSDLGRPSCSCCPSFTNQLPYISRLTVPPGAGFERLLKSSHHITYHKKHRPRFPHAFCHSQLVLLPACFFYILSTFTTPLGNFSSKKWSYHDWSYWFTCIRKKKNQNKTKTYWVILYNFYFYCPWKQLADPFNISTIHLSYF